MSLARTALRIAAVAALQADTTIAALCPGRVFDSRIDKFDASTPVPMIVVLTEEDGGEARNPQNGGPPFREMCELSFEIACRQIAPDSPDGDPQIATPETDRELEALIDLLEHRAIAAVTVSGTVQSLLVRQAVTRRVTKFASTRFVSAETAMKLAVREVRLTIELKGVDPGNPLDAPTGPFAVLPEPLFTVANAMVAGSSGYLTCQMIAAAMAGIVPQTFTGVDATYAVQAPAYPPVPPLALTDPNVPDPFGDAITIPAEAADGP